MDNLKYFLKVAFRAGFEAIAIYGAARKGSLCFMFSRFPVTFCKLDAL